MIAPPLDILALGAVSAAGRSIQEHLEFVSGRAPFVQINRLRDPSAVDGELETCSAGPLDLRSILRTPKTAKFMSREMALAYLAAVQVRPSLSPSEPQRIGVVLATAPALSALEEVEAIHRRCTVDGVLQPSLLAADLPALIPATWPSRCIKATTACHIAAELGWVGPNVTLTPGRVATFSALATAALLLDSGACTAVLTGGADCRTDRHSVAEVVERWRELLGKERLLPSDLPYRPSEGAGLLLVARSGEYPEPVARLLGYHRVVLDGQGQHELAAAVTGCLSALAAQVGERTAAALWLDVAPERAAQAEHAALAAAALGVSGVHRVRTLLGDSGGASAALALCVACARAGSLPSHYQVVLSICASELQGVAVGSVP